MAFDPSQTRDAKGMWAAGAGAAHHEVASRHGFELKSVHDEVIHEGTRTHAVYRHADGREIHVSLDTRGRSDWSAWRNKTTTLETSRGHTASQLQEHLSSPAGQKSGRSDRYVFGRRV